MRPENGHARVCVGFFLPWEKVAKAFSYTRKEQYHVEDRFDPKTGRQVSGEKIVDVEGGRYVKVRPDVHPEATVSTWFCPKGQDPGHLEGAEEGDFFEELGEYLGCRVAYFGGDGQWYVSFDILGEDCGVPNTSYDLHQDWDAGPAISLSKVTEASASFKAQSVREKLEGVGLKVGAVLIFPVLHLQF